MPHTEENIARLEEQAYFQEKMIADLNQALTHQQFQIDTMEKRLRLSEERLAALLPLLSEGGHNIPPPHYGSG